MLPAAKQKSMGKYLFRRLVASSNVQNAEFVILEPVYGSGYRAIARYERQKVRDHLFGLVVLDYFRMELGFSFVVFTTDYL